jgi:hypothetical protein
MSQKSGSRRSLSCRSTDSVVIPRYVPGLSAWYDTSTSAYYTAGADYTVSQLKDQSGLGRHLTAAGAAKPTATRSDNLENFLTYSEDFSNAAWSLSAATRTANQANDPINGTLTADKIIEDGTNANHIIYRTSTISVEAGENYRFSVYAKSNAASTSISLRFNGSAFTASSDAHFDLPKGMINGTAAWVTAQIDRVSTDWYRCTAWCTAVASGTLTCQIFLARPAGTISYQGDSTSSCFVWGAQLAYAGSATAYLATTTTAMYAGFDYGASGVDVVPNKAAFWANVVEWAPYLNDYCVTVGISSDSALAQTYYEGELGRYMLADYTRDTATYYPMADIMYHAYRNYYCVPNTFHTPGYWAFGEGFAERYIRRQLGINYVVNPSFTSGVASWTATTATLTSVAGGQAGNCLSIANNAGTGTAKQTYVGWKQTVYSFSYYFKKGTCASGRVYIGTTDGASDLYDSGALTDAAWTQKTATVTTPNSTTTTVQNIYITLFNGSATGVETSLFDEFSLTTVQAKTDLEQLCLNASYHNEHNTGFNTIEGNWPNAAVDGHNMCREWAYCVYNYIQLGRLKTLSAPQISRRDFCFEDLFRIVDWWHNKTASYFRPFMCALVSRSLIAYYEYVSKDVRIIPALVKLAALVTEQYIPAVKACYYTDREGGLAWWSAGALDRDPNGVPDLNQLISPLFGWLWKMTADPKYRSMGDDLFTGGISVYAGASYQSGAYLGTRSSSNPAGKQYDQQYDWGKRYLEWAETTPTVSGKSHLIFNGTANGMSGTNGATAQPTTDIFAIKCIGASSAVRSLVDTTGRALAKYNASGAIELNAGTALTYTNTRGSKEVISVITNGATSKIRKNRQQVASGAAGASVPGATLYLGQSAVAADFYKGDIYEHIRYNRALSDTEVAMVEGYLGGKHGITLYTPPPIFSPSTYGTVLAWWNLTDTTKVLNPSATQALNGEAIDTITDSGPGSITIQQTTAGYRPTLITNALNGFQVMQGDGARGFPLSIAQHGYITRNKPGLTFWAVVKDTDTTAAQKLLVFGDNAAGVRFVVSIASGSGTEAGMIFDIKPQDAGTPVQLYSSGGLAVQANTWTVLVLRCDFAGNVGTAWRNSSVSLSGASLNSSGNSSDTASIYTPDSQLLGFNGYGAAGFKGQIAEMGVWSGALSDANVNSAVSVLKSRYAIA